MLFWSNALTAVAKLSSLGGEINVRKKKEAQSGTITLGLIDLWK